MRTRRTPPWPHLPLAAAASGLILLGSAPATVAADKAAFGTEAVAACEQAARQSLGPPAQSAEITFSPPPTVQEGLSNDNQVVLRGAGRWRTASGRAQLHLQLQRRPAHREGGRPGDPRRGPGRGRCRARAHAGRARPERALADRLRIERGAGTEEALAADRADPLRRRDPPLRAEDAEPRRAARHRPRAAGAGGAADALRLRVRDRHHATAASSACASRAERRQPAHPLAARVASGRAIRLSPRPST